MTHLLLHWQRWLDLFSDEFFIRHSAELQGNVRFSVGHWLRWDPCTDGGGGVAENICSHLFSMHFLESWFFWACALVLEVRLLKGKAIRRERPIKNQKLQIFEREHVLQAEMTRDFVEMSYLLLSESKLLQARKSESHWDESNYGVIPSNVSQAKLASACTALRRSSSVHAVPRSSTCLCGCENACFSNVCQ